MNWATKTLAGLSFVMVSGVGVAHAAPTPDVQCGLTGTASAPINITYDPFKEGAAYQETIPLYLTRIKNPDKPAQKTQQVYFVMTKPDGTLANIEVLNQNGQNILYPLGSVPPGLPVANSNASGQIWINFRGASQPDTLMYPITVKIPPFSNLQASQVISLGIRFLCDGTGGMTNVTTPADTASAITINVNVLSALQAYYSGGPMDFGDISDETNATAPGRSTITPQRFVNVRSSGAYTVAMTSQHDYRLTFDGSNMTDPAQRIPYRLRFLGQDMTTGNHFTTTACSYAGVPIAMADQLNITPTLLEGGKGKMVANYQDELTVTVTPQLGSPTAGAACDTL